jgi:hypothetical protein
MFDLFGFVLTGAGNMVVGHAGIEPPIGFIGMDIDIEHSHDKSTIGLNGHPYKRKTIDGGVITGVSIVKPRYSASFIPVDPVIQRRSPGRNII